MNRQKKIVWSVLAVIILIGVVLLSGNRFYVDYLWFSEMGYLDIFFKELITKVEIGVPLFIILLAIFYFYLKFLKRLSEKYLGISGRKSSVREKRIGLILSVVVAFIVTMTVTDGVWNEVLLAINSSDFGTTDALYNMDLSFYFFLLPLLKAGYRVVLNGFVIMVVVTLVYTAYVLYREGDDSPRHLFDLADLGDTLKDFGRTFLTLASKQIGIFLSRLASSWGPFLSF